MARTSTGPVIARSGRSLRTRRAWTLASAAVVSAVLVYVGAMQARRMVSASKLPPLPDLAGQPAAIGEHLRERHRAAERDPLSPSTVGALCLAYHADLFLDHAERCYALLSDGSSSEWRWTYYRALIQSERGGGDALAGSLHRVITAAPEFGPAWWRLGESEFKAGRYDAAFDAWTRAAAAPEPDRPRAESPSHVADVPLAAHASLGLARIALSRGDAEQARQNLERVTSQAPRFGPAHRLLAEGYRLLGRTADADRATARAGRLSAYAPYADPMVDALARESRSSTFLLRQAAETTLASNPAWVEYLIRRAREFDPDNPDVVSKLGGILRALGRSRDALDLFMRYREMVPSDLQALGQIGTCLTDLGRYGEAENYLRRALEGLDDAVTHYNLGVLFATTGRFDEAAVEYQRAVDRDPDDLVARGNLAAVLVRQGQLARASRELARVLGRDPENAAAHTNYGVLLLQQGQEAQAAREFQTALRLDPGQAQAAEALRELGR